jgi:hypothetical protein
MFIPINTNQFVNAEGIEAIEGIDDISCKVYCHHNIYISNISKEGLIEIIESAYEDEEKNVGVPNKENLLDMFKDFLNNQERFAG